MRSVRPRLARLTDWVTAGITPAGEAAVSKPQDDRIQREEEYWNAPRLFGLGFAFLGACLLLIYVMASV